MAKKSKGGAPENKKADAPAADKRKSPTQAAAESFKYGVKELAKELGIQDTSVRVQLRNKNVAKDGAVYGWNNEKDFQAVVKQLRGDDKKAKAKAE